MDTTEKEINPVQIAYITYQLRQAEILRNKTKRASEKKAMTERIHQLHFELDPLLEMYAAQESAKRKNPNEASMIIGGDTADKDIGPEEVVQAMHTYCEMKITQVAVTNHLATDQPLSIAGEYDNVMYIMHFEKKKP